MDRERIKNLNDRQRRWLDHLKKCAASGMNPREYAKANGLNYSIQEKMRRRLEGMGVLEKPISMPSDSPMFQKVSVSPVVLNYGPIQLTLPNGVNVSIGGDLDAGGLGDILILAARIQ